MKKKFITQFLNFVLSKKFINYWGKGIIMVLKIILAFFESYAKLNQKKSDRIFNIFL